MDQPIAASEKSPAATVQHVSRKCSDQLLSKFADPGNEDSSISKKGLIRLPSRRPKKNQRISDVERSESPSRWSGGSFAEKRTLLLPPVGKKRSRSRSSGRKRSLLGAIEETWRRTVEGASRVFVETHYNRHKRLISDVAA